MNVVITDDLLMLKCYMWHLLASQILKLKSKYLRPISSLMFHLALFPCKQSPRSTSQHPNWALRNRQAPHRAAEEGENKPKHVLLWPPRTALPCHAVPCQATPGKQTVTSTLGGPRLMPALSSFFFNTSLLHPSLSLSPSLYLCLPSIWRDSFGAGRWSPSAHSHLIKRSHSTFDNVTDGC